MPNNNGKRSLLSNFKWIEKIIIPSIAIAFVFVTSDGANKIAKEQNNIAKEQNNMIASEQALARQNISEERQLKLLEIFYDELKSSDVKMQKEALNLLKDFSDPTFTRALSDWVSKRPQSSESLKEEANKITEEINNSIIESLKNYQIKIRYQSNLEEYKSDADTIYNRIKSLITEENENNIERVAATKEAMRDWGARSYEIRYWQPTETAEAKFLKEKIIEKDSIQISLREATTETRRFLSIFLAGN